MSISVETSTAIYRLYDRFMEDKHQTFVILGSQAGEGATYSSLRIGEGASELLGGHSVLIIDMNTQNRSLSKYVGAPERGWGDWLTGGKDYSLTEAVTTLEKSPGMSILPIGSKPSKKDLARLVMQWPDVLNELRQHYDVILIDSAPYFNGQESRVLCKAADDVMVVIEAEQTRKPMSATMIDGLQSAGCSILGVIFNKRQFHIPQWAYQRFL